MTYLLKGGPRDGELVKLERNCFRISRVTEVYEKDGVTLRSRVEDQVYEREFGETDIHPDRKRPVKVWRYRPAGQEDGQ